MVTSGLENSQNKWLPIMLLIHDDDDDDDVIMMFNDSINSSGLTWELKHNLILTNDKILTY
jgi:hypothetical protein